MKMKNIPGLLAGLCMMAWTLSAEAGITAILQTYNGDGASDFVATNAVPLSTNCYFMVFRTTNSGGAGFNPVNPLAPQYGDVLLGTYPIAQTNFPGSAGQITGYLAEQYAQTATGYLYLAVFDGNYADFLSGGAVPESTRYALTTNAPVTAKDSSQGGTLTDVGGAINDYVALHGAWVANQVISETHSASIGLSTQMLDFASTYQDVASPAGQVVTLSNNGGIGMAWTNEVSYSGSPSSWASLAPSHGNLLSGSQAALTARVNSVGFNAGVYTATIAVVSAQATNSPQNIQVRLTVARADQAIDFPTIGSQYTTSTVSLNATADSGLTVTYGIASGPGQLAGSVLSFLSTGVVNVTASQAGNGNWNAAVTVTQSVTVAEPPPTGSLRGYLTPSFLVTNGGQWRVLGVGSWRNPGEQVDSLTPGNYHVEFSEKLGWRRPLATGVTVVAGSVTAVTGAYERLKSPNDFDGDGISDIGCYDPSSGSWFVFKSFLQVLWTTNYAGGIGTLPVTGDFDGDGYSDYGTYYPPSGYWKIMRTTAGQWTNNFGFDGTEPVTGDFDGDGILDFGCYYPPNGGWFIFKSRDGFWANNFGYDGTIPVTGDFDGDGIGDFGCYYPPDGGWFIFKSATKELWTNKFGFDGTEPVTGDFDGDGIDDFGCYYPESGTWFIYKSRDGFWTTNFGFGGTLPVVGDYDGDGIDDFGCYYPSDGGWFLYKSRDGLWTTKFGYGGTLPIK